MEKKTIDEFIEKDVMKNKTIDSIIENGVVTPEDRYLLYYDILMLIHGAKIKAQNNHYTAVQDIKSGKITTADNMYITEGIIRGLEIAKEIIDKYFWE